MSFESSRFPSGLAGGSMAYAEYVSVPAPEVARKPAGIDHVHAAGAPMSLLTAWQFLIELGHNEPNPLQPNQHEPVPLEGKTVLVNGAAGGVGHFAVQVAKLKGAHVIAVASARHESLLHGLGADEFIDYTKTAPEGVTHDIDLVIDALGGPSTGRFLRTLKRGGALFAGHHSKLDESMFTVNLSIEAMSRAALQRIPIDGTRQVVEAVLSI